MNNPLLNNHFTVEWGGSKIAFTEVSGLTIEREVVEYRPGSSPEDGFTKIPGLQKFSNIVLKRGITKGDNEFYDWIKSVSSDSIERRDIVINLLDRNHNPVMTWKVRSAWPVKLQGPELNANGNEVAIETLELTHEGITIESD
jgi:phage tail-like protein